MKDSNRIVFNTIIKYIELLCNIIVGIVSLRLILQVLGTEDYGIYMVVAGVIAMLGVLSSSMSNTAMRFMAHTLGKVDIDKSCKSFNTCLAIHLVLGLLLVIILEVGGLIMFEYFLNIPYEKIESAKFIFHFMVLNSFLTILTVPYDAIINSHENLLFLSSTVVLQNILKLLLISLLFLWEGDRLFMYGVILSFLCIFTMTLRIVYSRSKYAESAISFSRYFDKSLAKSMFAFTGWELFNSISSVLTTQLRGILINMFFGVRLNAGEGIAKNVNSQANMVSVGITNAITPQMNKSEGAGDRQRLILLTNIGVKYTSFMFGLVAIPLIMETPFVLKVWLKDVPEFAVVFCQLCIIMQLISKLTWQIGNAIRAVGKIKFYRIVSGCISILGVIIAYFVLKFGGGPLSIFIVEILVCIISGMVTLLFGKKIVGIDPLAFLRETTIPILIPLFVTVITVLLVQSVMPEGWLRLFFVCTLILCVFSLLFWILGVKKDERNKLSELFSASLSKVFIWKK